MTSDGAEYRFWLYCDTTNQNRYISDTGSVFELRTDTTGKLLVYTKRGATGYATNAYTAVGTYAVGWTEYRIVLDFSADTYKLSKRAASTDAWTQLKATGASAYDIPMREATDRTTTANLLFRGYQNSNLWIDDVRFGDGSSYGPAVDTTPPGAPTLSAYDYPNDAGGAIRLASSVPTDNVGVTGYRIYRGTSPGSYSMTSSVPLPPSPADPLYARVSTGIVTGVFATTFAISALDAAGNYSARSPEQSAVAVYNQQCRR